MIARWTLAASICLASSLSAADGDSSPLAIGQKAPAIAFTDIRYLPRTLADFGEVKAYVIVLVKSDCPLVARYGPKLKALDEVYRAKGVQFLALNVGAGDSVTEAAWQAVQADWAFPGGQGFRRHGGQTAGRDAHARGASCWMPTSDWSIAAGSTISCG